MKPEAQSKTLAFISSSQQLRYLNSDQMAQLHGIIHYVCMTPSAEYSAHKMGLSYSSAEDYYDPIQLMKIASAEWKYWERFAKYLDSELDASFNGICSNGYFNSVRFMLLLKTFRDSVLSKLHILHSIIEYLMPSRVICFTDNKTSSGYEEDYRLGDLTFLILELLKSKVEYKLICYEMNTKNTASLQMFDVKRTFERVRRVRQSILTEIKLATHHDPRQNHELPTISIGESNTLAALDDYVRGWKGIGGKVVSIDKMAKRCRILPESKKKNSLLAQYGITADNIKRFNQSLFAKSDFKDWFEHKGMNFSAITNPWFEQYLRFTFPNCVQATEMIETNLMESSARALLSPMMVHSNQIAAALACKRLGVKIYTIQHGGGGCFAFPVWEYADYLDVDYAFVHGQGVADNIREKFHVDYREDIGQPIATGNPHLYDLFKNQRKKKVSGGKQRRILYVLTHLIGDFHYFGWNHYPNIWYSHLQQKVLDTVKDYPEVTVYVKQYPGMPMDDPLQQYVNDKNMKNVTFLPNYVAMERYIDAADLFLIDFPVTSLPIMLCTRKPVIVYYNPDYLKMSQDAQLMLENRVDLCRTEDELLSTIGKFCRLPAWPELDSPDDVYLIHYGLGESGTNPAEQVIKYLKSTLI